MIAKGMLVFVHLSLIIALTQFVGVAKGKADNDRNSSFMPTNITCVNYSFERIKCTWSLSTQDINYNHTDLKISNEKSINEDVKMYFTRYGSNDSSEIHCNWNTDFVEWHACQNQNPTSCSWKYPNDSAPEWFSVMVTVRNRKTDTFSKTCSHGINVYDIIKPAPVTDIKVTKFDCQCLGLFWKPPHRSMDFNCTVSVSSDCTGSQTLTVSTKRQTRMNDIRLCDLHPYTNIVLSIKCRTMIGNTEKGYWSDSVVLSNRTEHDVPSMAPNTTEGLYEVSSERKGLVSVQLYFNPLDTCELHDNPAHVVYSVEALDKSVTVPHPSFFVKINVPKDKEINISLKAKNSAGLSNATRVVTIFPDILVPKSARLNIEHYVNDSGCTTKATIIQTEDSANFTDLYNTIVWCQANLTFCQEPLKWIVVCTNETVLPVQACMLPFYYGLITHGYNIKKRKVTSTSIYWLELNTTLLQNAGYESERGSSFKYVLPATAALFPVAITPVIVIIIIRYRRKSRSSSATEEQSMCTTSFSSSSSSFSSNQETDPLLKHRDDRRRTKDWTTCIHEQNIVLAAKLSQDKILPTNNELQQISSTFGRKSITLRDACLNICDFFAQKLGNISEVWPAYSPLNDRIVFVVETSETLSNIQSNDFEIHLVDPNNTLEKESLKVMLREHEVLASYKYDVDKIKQLKESISKNAGSLMNKHKTIIALCPSVVKSVNYNNISGEHKMIDTLCISIRVEKKVRDLIPLDEDQIPADIGGFPTDVLQGTFSPFGNGPNDYQKEVKIGCGIHAGVRNEKGDVLGGTLGGFVQHEKHGLCCITCAHLILSLEELTRAKTNGYIEYAFNTGRMVFQPAGERSTEFGRFVAAAYEDGSGISSGVEAALIKVFSRHPTSGSFPQANEGSDADKHFVYNSGNVTDVDKLKPMTEVYKFGMSTGPTIGDLGLSGTAVRIGCNQVNDPNFGIQLYNQTVIYPKGNSSFAKTGDSGALVFIGHTRPGTEAAIGMVEGGFENGKILVSPLFNVLKALKCPPYLKRFENSSDSGIHVDMPEGAKGCDAAEEMEWN